MGQPQPSLSPPSFCHPFFCHSYSRFFAVPILAWQLRRRLYSRRDPFSNAMGQPQPSLPPSSFCHPFFCHSSFAFFRFFWLSPKNHPSVLSVSRKKEKKTKECYCLILAFCGSDLDRGRAHSRRRCFLQRTGSSAADFSPPHFSAIHFSAIPTLVSLPSRFSRGNHGDAYIPDAIPSPTPWDNRSHLSRPHLSAIHFSAIPILVSLRSRFSRGNDGDAYTPDAIPSPKPWDNRSHLSRPHLSAIHFSAIPFFAFFRFFCYHRNSLCARPAWHGLSALIYLAGRTLPGALPQAGMDRAFGPYCHCSATRAPTARPIPPWGNAPRKAAPPPHLRRYKS